MLDKLEALQARFDEIGIALTNPEIVRDNKRFSQLSKEYRQLEHIVKARQNLLRLTEDIQTYKEALQSSDPE